MHASIDTLPAQLGTRLTDFCERHMDPQTALLRGPDGRLMTRGSMWHALGLLQRGATQQAVPIINAVLDAQWQAPGQPWHGTFRRYPDEPDPPRDARMWRDYDPNWRQFIGVTLLLALRRHALPVALQARMRAALGLCLAGEPRERLDARYTNIALLQAWLLVEAGALFGVAHWQTRGRALAADIERRFERWGVFDEYNSPTYYGVDLVGLALWARESSALAGPGRRLEAALWDDLLAWFHPALGTQCGPFSRAYGMHMREHVTLQGLWLEHCSDAPPCVPWPVDAHWPAHGHDLAMMPLVKALAGSQRRHVRTGRRALVRHLPDGRVAQGWLGEHIMLGAERGGHASAADQYHPFTAHWPGGWLRLRGAVRCDARLDADGRAEVAVQIHRDPHAPFWLEVSGPMGDACNAVVPCGAVQLRLGGTPPAVVADGRIGWNAACSFSLSVVPA